MKIPAVIFSTLLIGSIVCAWIGAHDPAHNPGPYEPGVVEELVYLSNGYGIYFKLIGEDKLLIVDEKPTCSTLTFYRDGHCIPGNVLE
jgi:hypothetical protein